MPHSFTMEYVLQNRTARELYDKLSALKTIGKMQISLEQAPETRMVYVLPMTAWKDGHNIMVAFHDQPGGAKVGILSTSMRPMVIFDGGQNERNCIDVRNAIASSLK